MYGEREILMDEVIELAKDEEEKKRENKRRENVQRERVIKLFQ